MSQLQHASYAVIGAGPAGLMAAEQLAQRGKSVIVFDAMPSVARKFLLAGIGGMNITHSEELPAFINRYREASGFLQPYLEAFSPEALREWIHSLGIETFVGTSGRVFPKEMKAAPLLRAWLSRLRQLGVQFKTRHQLADIQQQADQPTFHFLTPNGEQLWQFDHAILALGGASYPRLGSTGHWQAWLGQLGVDLRPLVASNCGFELPWSDYLQQHFAGTPLKQVRLELTNLAGQLESKTGEFIISQYGIEGSLVYALSAPLRELMIHQPQQARLYLDMLPNKNHQQIIGLLNSAKKGMSFSNLLRKKLNLPPIANALLKECAPELNLHDSEQVAALLKRLPLPLVTATRPIEEVISCAGGVQTQALSQHFELKQLPGVFAIGEMVDWEAPTGGYLLTACLAMGHWLGQHI